MSRKISTLLFIMMVMVTVFGIVGVGLCAEKKAAKDPAEKWEETIRKFEAWDRQNAWPKQPILFVGSSSIRMWQTREAFPDQPVINRGFGGSMTSDVNYFIERIVLKYQPSKIVFYCGDNDIAKGKSAEVTFKDYQKFVRAVHAKLPKTTIIFVTIKPSRARWDLWPEMNKANEMVRKMSAKDKRLIFADCATCLLKGGKPDDGLFVKDRLHLNAKGYVVWNKVIGPLLQN